MCFGKQLVKLNWFKKKYLSIFNSPKIKHLASVQLTPAMISVHNSSYPSLFIGFFPFSKIPMNVTICSIYSNEGCHYVPLPRKSIHSSPLVVFSIGWISHFGKITYCSYKILQSNPTSWGTTPLSSSKDSLTDKQSQEDGMCWVQPVFFIAQSIVLQTSKSMKGTNNNL